MRGPVPDDTAPGHAFTTLWTADQVRRIKRAGIVGTPVAVTFGGPHLSAPSFARAGVRPGDDVIPVHVRDGRLVVLTSIRVAEILPVEAFVARYPGLFDPMRGHAEYQRLARNLDTAHLRAFWQLRLWLEENPEVAALCPGEATEVVVARASAPLQLDRVVPLEIVGRLRWQSGRRAERPIRHLGPDGRIERSISLQGIYRLLGRERGRAKVADRLTAPPGVRGVASSGARSKRPRGVTGAVFVWCGPDRPGASAGGDEGVAPGVVGGIGAPDAAATGVATADRGEWNQTSPLSAERWRRQPHALQVTGPVCEACASDRPLVSKAG
jgi:hypothetical protein